MGKPTVKGQPTCRQCTRLNHEECTGCTGCGCERSAQWSAYQSRVTDSSGGPGDVNV